MPKKISPADNAANMSNGNKGSRGTNLQYDQNQGNRGTQMAQNRAAATVVKPERTSKETGKKG